MLLFNYSPNNSINNRLMRGYLTSMICGYCLLRIIHCMHVTRSLQPSNSILLVKVDVESACIRCSMRGKVVAMSVTSLRGKAAMSLREIFCGAFGTHLFSRNGSEPAANLENDMISCNKWDEEVILSPHLKSSPPLSLMPSSVTFS